MNFSIKLTVVALMLLFFFVANVAYAAKTPPFMNGDKNYPLIWEDSQAMHYLDRSSVKVSVNDAPFFIITAQTVTAGGNATYKFFFDESEPDMRVFDFAVGDWRYLNPSKDADYRMYIGEAIFYFARGRKFYGNYLWKTEADGKTVYTDKFNDELYQGWD